MILAGLQPVTFAALAVCFVLAGIIRSGLGVGANAFVLPLALYFYPQPVPLVAAFALHNLLLCTWHTARHHRTVAWPAVWRVFQITLPFFFVGVWMLLSLQTNWLMLVIYGITGGYGLLYLLGRDFRSGRARPILENVLLAGSGWATGVMFAGGALLAAVLARRVPAAQMRDSMLATGSVNAFLKVGSLVLAGVVLPLPLTVALLPAALLGHFAGLQLHDQLVGRPLFLQILGGVLLAISLLGATQLLTA